MRNMRKYTDYTQHLNSVSQNGRDHNRKNKADNMFVLATSFHAFCSMPGIRSTASAGPLFPHSLILSRTVE